MNYEMDTAKDNKAKDAKDVARMVFSFVSAAEAFVDEMDSVDDFKLLRLRTRKNEFVILPG